MGSERKGAGRLLRTLRSVKLAVSLLVVMAVVLIVATVMKDQSRARRYIYQSWWFISLLGFFCLNLFLCTAGRWSLRAKKLRTTMTHVGVVIMVVGVVVGAILGERGYMQLYIGRSGNTFYAGRKERIALPFVVHLEDFRVERYRGRLVQERLIVQVADRGLVSDFPVDVGRKFEVTGTPYSVTTLRYEPDFLVLGPGSYGSRSSEPNNPAIQVQVDGGSDSRTEWVFAKFPGMHRGPDSNVWLFYRRIGTIGRIKAFKSDVRLYEGGRVVASKTIEVNKPLKHRGYSIYQSDYDAEEELYSVLGITRDPGVSLVYAGFVLISAGLLFNFYLRPLG